MLNPYALISQSINISQFIKVDMERHFYHYIFALIFVQYCLTLASTAMKKTNIATDQSALLALKAHITSDPYQFLSKNWSSNAAISSVCDWIGVKCGSKHHRVTSLNISGMGLTGTIPPELGNLSFLFSLDMGRNYFHGNLPKELSRLRRLRFIRLRSNNFTGEIPIWLGHFPELQILFLDENNFNGSIPSSLSNLAKLQSLDFDGNSLTGRIPEELGNLYSLKFLNLEDNQLVGSIPVAMFNITTLEYVGLTFNNLSGTLPVDICHHLPNLKGIYLSFNQIHGQIPPSLSQCSRLQVLSLSENKFSGHIPKEIGNLGMLEYLFLGSNNLQGVIPAEIGNLRQLKELGIEENHITGSIPREIGNLRQLKRLGIQSSHITGSIPREIGNLTMLNKLILHGNSLTGEIPPEICNLQKLERLNMGFNRLSGPIPAGIFNLSRLRIIGLEFNSLTGNLPPNMGDRLPNLEKIYLDNNQIGGVIPASIANSSKLSALSLGNNKFTGPVPNSLGELALLEFLRLLNNSLTGDLEFITSLTKCKYLRYLFVSLNPFHGILPVSIGNLSTSLENFQAGACGIKGSIPSEIGNLSSLIAVDLQENQLNEVIPFAFNNLHNLQVLLLSENELSSNIDSFCKMHMLSELYLSRNRFLGPIPNCFGNMTSLRKLYLQSNGLTSVPGSLWELQDLLELNLSSNSISEILPLEIRNLKASILLDMSRNQITGKIPSTVGDLKNLQSLSLAHNHLQGSIPESTGDMLSLTSLDLSYNNLFGLIPKSLEALIYLKCFNVSFNHLTGEIPSGGPFKNFTFKSFIFNDALCGDPENHVPRCQPISIHRSKVKKALRIIFIILGSTATVVALASTFLFLRLYRRKHGVKSSETSLLPVTTKGRVSYYELLRATDEYNDSNLLGFGSFGSVYKGILNDGSFVAVKVFNLQQEGALKSFDAECEVLRNLRHRNLVKVISSCCTDDFKALAFQYMPNGSLEKWLYSHNYFLNFIQRLNIMIDVAKALQYLHYEYSITVIHCDLKPSNILIDEDMVARVSDFGIAKFLGKEESVELTKTLATIGYIAPEYGLEGLVSMACDVYSYGIILLEVFTRRKPNDELFPENMNLKSWVNDAMPNSVHQVIDANLLESKEENLSKKLECLLSLMRLALNCVSEYPKERLSINDVLATLEKIKFNYLA